MKKPRRIFLVGMMGSGKSTVGPLLAKIIRWRFVDLDAYIAKKAGTSIQEIFERRGERWFRQLEASSLKSCSVRVPVVVATGGGAVLLEENRKWMRETGIKVYLKGSPRSLWARLDQWDVQKRPLLTRGAPFQSYQMIYRERKAVFEEESLVVNAVGAPHQIARRILDKLPKDILFSPNEEKAVPT